MIGVWDRDERCKMQHGITSEHRRSDAMRIANVAGEDFELTPYSRVALVEPAPGTEGVVEHESANIEAFENETLGDMRAYEPVRSGDQNSFHTASVE
jgi:hypothetical protein